MGRVLDRTAAAASGTKQGTTQDRCSRRVATPSGVRRTPSAKVKTFSRAMKEGLMGGTPSRRGNVVAAGSALAEPSVSDDVHIKYVGNT